MRWFAEVIMTLLRVFKEQYAAMQGALHSIEQRSVSWSESLFWSSLISVFILQPDVFAYFITQ